jgi:hypothetical protein
VRGLVFVTTSETDGVRTRAFAEPRGALYAAACAFTDRCYVGLRLEGEGVAIVLRRKPGKPFDGAAITAELEEEIRRAVFRERVLEEGHTLEGQIAARAWGVAGILGSSPEGAPNLDDLASFEDPIAAKKDPSP